MAMPPDGIASTWLARRSASVSESERASLFIPFIIVATQRWSTPSQRLRPQMRDAKTPRRSLIEQNFQDDLRGNGEAAARVLEDGVNLFAGHAREPES
jgi:hypothetical protein